MIKGNCRWIVIGVTLFIFLTFPIWATYLFQTYVDIYSKTDNDSSKALLLKKYLEIIDRCPPTP